MKILHINSYYNGSIFYKNLYDQQVKNGLDISVFVPVASSVSFSNEVEKNQYGIYTTLSANYNKCDRFVFPLKHNKIYKDLTSKYEIETYSVIHAHSLFSNGYIALRLKKQFGIPYIVAVRNTDVNLFFKKMLHLRKVGVEILKNSEHVVFLSKAYRDEVAQKYVPKNYEQRLLNKSSIIINGIDDFWLNNRRDIREAPDVCDLKLLYVGVVNKNKNIVTTVKAIEILRSKGIKVTLTVVGRIESQTEFNKMSNLDFVKYVEPKPKEELMEIYRQNDIFVMPSIHETFGLVYAEAISQGLPVIYTRGQGFDGHFSEGEVGYSVEPQNAQDVACKLMMTIANYDYLSRNCINNASKFSWKNLEQDYKHIYCNLL